MDETLDNRTAVVTASSDGLGLAAAIKLAALGAEVWLNGRSSERLELAKERIAGVVGRSPGTIVGDIASISTAQQIADLEPDIITYSTPGPHLRRFLEATDSDWAREFEIQHTSFARLIRMTIGSMLKRGWGRYVLISSRAAHLSRPHNVLSGPLRLPAIGLIRLLSSEFYRTGVTFNAVLPGLIDSPRVSSLLSGPNAAVVSGETPGTPEDFAEVVGFLASTASRHVNGQAIVVDGGFALGAKK